MWSGVELSLESGDFQVKWTPFISLPIKKKEILVKLEVWISSVPFYRSIRMDTSPKLCTARRGHTHTHTHAHAHTHSLSLSVYVSATHSLTLSLTLSVSVYVSVTHSFTHSLTHSLCLYVSVTHSLTPSLSPSLFESTSRPSTVWQTSAVSHQQSHRSVISKPTARWLAVTGSN